MRKIYSIVLFSLLCMLGCATPGPTLSSYLENYKKEKWFVEFDEPGCPIKMTLSENGTHKIQGIGEDYVRLSIIGKKTVLVLSIERICVIKP